MLYGLCLIQIFVYLIIIPVTRAATGDVSDDYLWWFALTFIASFLAGGALARHEPCRSSWGVWQLGRLGKLFLSLWAVVYVVISLAYGLYNRRIGTHEAGALFASIPVYVLVVFRSLEVILPFIFSMFVIEAYRKKYISLADRLVQAALIIVVLFSGILYSRSQLFFFVMIVAVIVQNTIDRSFFTRFFLSVIAGALLFAAGVTAYRLLTFAGDVNNQYVSREFLARLDGLEFSSKVLNNREFSLFGLSIDALLSPLISAIPFLPGGVELKAAAMTSVKAHILYNEFGSSQGDINSFVSLDLYYGGGVAALLGGGGAARMDVAVGRSKHWQNQLASH